MTEGELFGSEMTMEKIKFSVGYNEGRSRRERLRLFSTMTSNKSDLSTDFKSYISIVPNEIPLNKWFLKSNCRKHRNNKLILNLRGTIMERAFHRRFNDSDLDNLFVFLRMNPLVCGLYLAFNSLTNNGFARLCDFLSNQNTVHYVNVMNNDITYLYQKELVEAFSKWKVQCLNLRGNKFGRRGGETIAFLLTKNSTIRHLALGETDQPVISVISIVNTLIKYRGNETLTKLDLTKTLVGPNAGELCRHLACALEVNRTLVELVLSKNDITDADLEIFLEGLKYRNVLSRLNLSCNRISCHGAMLIADILPQSQLEMLVLATNFIGDTGCAAIGRAFAFTKLTYLDVSKNAIGDIGLRFLIWGINRPIDGLIIYGNPFSEITLQLINSQGLDSLLDCKCLDIKLWLDDEGHLRYTRRILWEYSEWYYYIPEWKPNSVIQHCCCPIRGGILTDLKS